MEEIDFSAFLEPVANTSAPAAVQAAPVAPVAVVKPEIKVVKKSVEETSTFDFSDYLEAVTDVLTAPPQAPAPVSEDPDRQFFQSGVGMEDRTFEPELGAADVATDLQVMEPPVDTAAPEAPVEFSFPTAGVTASSDLINSALPFSMGTTTATGDQPLTETQTRLKDLGYYTARVDGQTGPSTINALKTYQYKEGLPVTGQMDEKTRRALSFTGQDSRVKVADSGNALLSFIGKGEGGGYGAVNDYNSNSGTIAWGVGDSYFSDTDSKPLEELTIGEIKALQAGGWGTRKVFAVGAYQLIPDTLQSAQTSLGLEDSEVFSPELQDRIAVEYLAGTKRPDLRDYIQGTGSVSRDDAIEAFAKEWASIPVSRDTPRRYRGRDIMILAGESYYRPEGNSANHTVAQTETLLDNLRAADTTGANP